MTQRKHLQFIYWLVAAVLLVAGAIGATGRFWGKELGAQKPAIQPENVLRHSDAQTTSITTTDLCADVVGYKGATPLRIVVRSGVIDSVIALPNNETPGFFRRAMALTEPLIGQPAEEVMNAGIDAVSGATFSSQAIITNLQTGLAYAAAQHSSLSASGLFSLSVSGLLSLLVALMAAVLPLFIKDKRYHILQWLLNAGVLGFWTGTFVSYSSMISLLSNGTAAMTSLALIVLLIIAFVYPLFGKKQYYCTHVCPLGSAQQLLGLVSKRKMHLSDKVVKILTWFRRVLWSLLMLCLWFGFFIEWTDYELFSAFLVQSASWVILIAAGICLVLSVFIPRPYCRFVCPTGTLLKLSESQSINE